MNILQQFPVAVIQECSVDRVPDLALPIYGFDPEDHPAWIEADGALQVRQRGDRVIPAMLPVTQFVPAFKSAIEELVRKARPARNDERTPLMFDSYFPGGQTSYEYERGFVFDLPEGIAFGFEGDSQQAVLIVEQSGLFGAIFEPEHIVQRMYEEVIP